MSDIQRGTSKNTRPEFLPTHSYSVCEANITALIRTVNQAHDLQ